MEESEYRKNLVEIIDGSSTVFLNGKRVFIKHKSLSDIVDYELIYSNHFDQAQKKGLPTEEEILQQLNDSEIWTNSDEQNLVTKKDFKESLIRNKKNVVLESAIKRVEKQIEDTEAEIHAIEEKKRNLMSNSAESYATNRANDFYIVNSYYKDKEQKELLYTEEEYEYLDRATLALIIGDYSEFSKRFSEDSVQNLVLQDFYKVYYGFCETSQDFFGRPALDLTNFQLNLFIYTRIFKNIFENLENIPERIHKDPKALLAFANSSKTREQVKSKLDSDSAGASIVGATKEDMEGLGLETEGQTSLREEALKKGGSLSMKDLMKLSGA